MARRTSFHEYALLRRLKFIGLPPDHLTIVNQVPVTVFFNVVAQKGSQSPCHVSQPISLYEALHQLMKRLTYKNAHRRAENYKFMTKDFFRGLVFALIRGDNEPSNQLYAADLLHVISSRIYQAFCDSPSVVPTRFLMSAFNSMIEETAFPMLVVISSPNLDSLMSSISWALVNLVKSSCLLQNRGLETPQNSWMSRLMLVEYVVEAFDLQFRPISRLTHMLSSGGSQFDVYDLEDLDFDSLIPIFMILSQVPGSLDVSARYQPRLRAHFEQFGKFMRCLIAKCSASDDSLLLEVVAGMALLVFHIYLKSIGNLRFAISLLLLEDLMSAFATLNTLPIPSQEVMAIVACLTSALRMFAAVSESFISQQPREVQAACLQSASGLMFSLKTRLDWPTTGGSLLEDFYRFISSLTCSVPPDLSQRLLYECIFVSYGEGTINACGVLKSLIERKAFECKESLLDILQWLENIAALYIIPDGVEHGRLPGFQSRLVRAIISVSDLLISESSAISIALKSCRLAILYNLYCDEHKWMFANLYYDLYFRPSGASIIRISVVMVGQLVL